MDDIIISALVKSAQEIFSQAIKLFVEVQDVYIKKEITLEDEVGIITGLTGGIKGQVFIKFSNLLARKFVSSILNDVPIAKLDDSCTKILCDMSNMIICNAISDIYNAGIGIDLSIPALICGEETVYAVSDGTIYCIPFRVENDVIEVNVIFKKSQEEIDRQLTADG